jgi:hypothetical protein
MAVAVAASFPTDARAEPQAKISLYGFAQADFIYDGNRVDPLWEDTLRPTKIPTDPGTFGSNGQTSFSVKQSRFGVSGDIPVNESLGNATFKFEFDLFGTGGNAGLTTFRLRHAYGELGQVLAGQTNTVFMDIDVFPNVVDYWGPPGMVFIRNPQLRWTPYRSAHSELAFAIEKPSNDIDVGLIRQFDPELGANIQSDEKLPDFTMHWRSQDTWWHFQLAAIFRKVGYDTIGTPNNEPKGSRTGWGVNLSGHVGVFEKDKILAQVAYGEGISNYMNDGQTDLAPDLVHGGTKIRPQPIPVLGAMFYYDHYWSDEWSTSLGYSVTHNNNTVLQEPTAFRNGQYASVNLLWTPAKNFLFGVEGLWGQRTDHDGNDGQDLRVQFTAKYSFGTSFNI